MLPSNCGTEGKPFTYGKSGAPQYTDLVTNNAEQPYFFACYLYPQRGYRYLPNLMHVSALYYSFIRYGAYRLSSVQHPGEQRRQ